jgi:thioredoxin 1
MAKPALEFIAKKHENKITIGKIDAEDEPSLSYRYRVSSVPTFFIFENKKIIHQSTGLQILSVLRNKYNLD